jgi:uncharacterized membrane protein YebE (DUF533 family)
MHLEMEKLIEMALADGQVTVKEREIILSKAEKLGWNNKGFYILFFS